MGRKRSSAGTDAARMARLRRRRVKAKFRSDKTCPWCEKSQVVDVKYDSEKAWVENPLYPSRLIQIRIGKLRCMICNRTYKAGLLPGEGLIDLYCYWFDNQIAQIWYEIGLRQLFDVVFPCDVEYGKRDDERKVLRDKLLSWSRFLFTPDATPIDDNDDDKREYTWEFDKVIADG